MKKRHMGFYERILKRPLDFILSALAIIVLSPILLYTAILVRLKLGSPILFNQLRVGKNERAFQNYKFKSMLNELDSSGNVLSYDVRLTSFGRKFRASSLDELPELFNVLKGDMSLVGPRPLPTTYLPYYREEEHHRHDVRPGITGLAQVNGRNSLSWEEKFKYDIDYVNSITFFGDFKIFLRTVGKVLQRSDIGQGKERVISICDIRADMVKKEK